MIWKKRRPEKNKIIFIKNRVLEKYPQFFNGMYETKKCLILSLLEQIIHLFFVKKHFFECGGLVL